MNFSLPFSGSVAPSNWITTANPIQQSHATAVNDLLYSPSSHQADSDSDISVNLPQFYKNDPYSPPTPSPQQQQQQFPQHHQRQTYHYRSRANANSYLPPPLTNLNYERPSFKSQHIPQLQPPEPSNTSDLKTRIVSNYQSHHQTQAYDENRYEAHEFYNENISNNYNNSDFDSQSPEYDSIVTTTQSPITNEKLSLGNDDKTYNFPTNRPTYTQVQAGHGSNTQVHAVLDYDNYDDYDAENGGKH